MNKDLGRKVHEHIFKNKTYQSADNSMQESYDAIPNLIPPLRV